MNVPNRKCTNKEINRNRARVYACTSILLLAVGCGKSQGHTNASSVDENEPSSRPTLSDMMKVTSPGYVTPAGVSQECFGRIIFDGASKIEWPTFYEGDSEYLFYRSFSPKVADRGDEMKFGNTKIAVLGTATTATTEEVLKGFPSRQILMLQSELKDSVVYLEKLKTRKTKSAQELYEIQFAERSVKALQGGIKKVTDEFEAFDPGLADSHGYWYGDLKAADETDRYSVYRAYLVRASHIFVFESRQQVANPAGRIAHKEQFVKLLKKFRVRAPNEIPQELGVCLPHGFIPDDGKSVIEFKQSMRYADTPGVVYTLETGNVDARHLKSPEVVAVQKASIGMPGSGGEELEAKDFVTQRIGPRFAKIGGLGAEQGGVALTVKRPGKEPYEVYTIFTGYSGWLGTAVLPYISVDMHTYSKEQAPELKENPPTFKVTLDRLNLLLKSIRLRPTNPPMPDFATAKGARS